MKKLKKIKDKVLLHPIMSFLLLIVVVIVLSGILDAFDASVNYNKINPKTGGYESTLVTVDSLFTLSGLKYIFSNTVSNFVSFTPLSMILIVLIGIGIMDKSGLLDTLFFVFTKNTKKTTVTFVLSLMCIICSLMGDLCFIVFIPLAALLFKYGKRNPVVGIISSFAALSCGYAINLTLSSIESSMVSNTELAASLVTGTYTINTFYSTFIMIVATIAGAFLVTYVTEKIIAPKFGKYEVEEDEIVTDKEKLTKRELRGLIFAAMGAIAYLLVVIYNVIPNLPFGGNFLDYSQSRYIDKLFGIDSFFNSGFVFVVTIFFFVVGLLYGFGTKNIRNHRDVCNWLSHSLDGIGKVIVLLFFASTFISLLKYTNIGSLVTAALCNIVDNVSFSGIPLILLLLIVSIISTILLPSFTARWSILSGTFVPLMMTAGFTPEFAQLVFNAGSTVAYGLTPAMAYFVIYIAYLEKYNKDGVGLIESIKHIVPYALAFLAMWLCLLLLWYFISIPIGISTFLVL